MTHQQLVPPKLRAVVVWLVVALWGTSVAGQLGSQVWHYTWVAPSGLNELGTAVVMAMLAANQKAQKLGASPEEESTRDGPAPASGGDRE